MKPFLIIRFLHAGLLVFGLLAWLTGEWAESYRYPRHLGFTFHSWLGMGLSLFILMRLGYGTMGPAHVRFSQFFPSTAERWQLIWKDCQRLIALQLPTSFTHQGLLGFIKGCGLILFSWMAVTGSLMFFLLEPGKVAKGQIHMVMELHEVGESLIPLYLFLHVGGVVFYALKGRDIWRKMFFLS